jgi:uncharacterized lipoprotein YddW (UPF0748 family)
VHRAVKAARPQTQVSAAVFGNWLSARDSIGQDWVDWCRKGYLDFVCPMNYVPSDSAFRAAVRRQLTWLRGTSAQLYPGIGLSAEDLSAVELVEQIRRSRELRTGGFVVFEYDEAEANTVLPKLAMGLTGPRSR